MGEIFSMIGTMASNIALNLIAPGTGRLFAGVSAGGNAEKEARDNNASESSAYGYGILSAAANTTFDSLFGGIPGIVKGVVDGAMQRIAKERAIRRPMGPTQQNAEGNLAQRLAYNMLSPGFYSTNKSTQVDNVLNELYQKTGDQRALPKFANKIQTVGDEKNRYEKKLTKDEYTKFAQDSGKKAYDLLDVLVPGYKNLTDEQSVSATEKAYEVAADLAKNTALGSPLTQTTKNIIDAADKYSKDENKNVGIAEIIKANVIIRDIRSDEYPNGKPISGSAKRKKVQALVDSGYSRADAMKLYDLLNN